MDNIACSNTRVSHRSTMKGVVDSPRAAVEKSNSTPQQPSDLHAASQYPSSPSSYPRQQLLHSTTTLPRFGGGAGGAAAARQGGVSVPVNNTRGMTSTVQFAPTKSDGSATSEGGEAEEAEDGRKKDPGPEGGGGSKDKGPAKSSNSSKPKGVLKKGETHGGFKSFFSKMTLVDIDASESSKRGSHAVEKQTSERGGGVMDYFFGRPNTKSSSPSRRSVVEKNTGDAFFNDLAADMDEFSRCDGDTQIVGSKVYERSGMANRREQLVKIAVTPYQYYGIDPTMETFSASFKLMLETEGFYDEWVSKVEQNKDLQLPMQDCLFTMPRFLHKNSIDLQIFSSDWYAKCTNRQVTITKNQMMTSTCRNDYDLSDFPFDHQELQIVLFTIPEVTSVFTVVVDENMGKPNLISSFETNFKTPDWVIVPGSFQVISDSPPAGQRVVISVQVKRIWQSYIWNFYLVFFLITSSGYSSYVWNTSRGISEQQRERGEWNVQNPHDAITISLLALLTNISFKTYVSQVAPKVGYMTNLDVYIFGCLIVSSLQVGTHVLLVLGDTSPEQEAVYVVGGMTLIWVLFHVWYLHLLRSPRTRADVLNEFEPRATCRFPTQTSERFLHKQTTNQPHHSASVAPAATTTSIPIDEDVGGAEGQGGE